jgi:hypothetical protein
VRRGQRLDRASRQSAEALGHIGNGTFGDDIDESAIDFELAAEQCAEGCNRRDPPRPPLLRPDEELSVHSDETAPYADEAALCLGEEVDLFRAECLAADGELIVEIEERSKIKAPFGHRGRRRRQDRPQAQPTGEELTWPEDGDAGALEPAGAVEDQVGE